MCHRRKKHINPSSILFMYKSTRNTFVLIVNKYGYTCRNTWFFNRWDLRHQRTKHLVTQSKTVQCVIKDGEIRTSVIYVVCADALKQLRYEWDIELLGNSPIFELFVHGTRMYFFRPINRSRQLFYKRREIPSAYKKYHMYMKETVKQTFKFTLYWRTMQKS